MRILPVLLLGVALLSGCSAARPAAPPASLADATKAWVSPEGRSHPLAGRAWDVARERFVPASAVVDAAVAADFLLLGEQHDNVDHHRMQNGVLLEMVARGRRPAMAFEQVDLEKQGALDFALAEDAGATPSDRAMRIAEAVGWSKGGWPPFDQYRPLFETALAAGLPLEAANLSRTKMHELFSGAGKTDGSSAGAGKQVAGNDDAGKPGANKAVAEEEPDRFQFTDAQKASMKEDIVDSHCGYAPDGMVTAMIEGQRRRDGEMARVVTRAAALPAPDGRDRGAVLVCGFAHARRDYGVPAHLALSAPGRRVVSIAFVEVFPSGKTPADYAEALHAKRLPFDYVLFTPRTDDEDPCEKFRTSLGKLKEGGTGHGDAKAAGQGTPKP